MIQLATDPKASRSNWAGTGTDAKDASAQQRGRGGHAWPFISRHAERPVAQQPRERAPNTQSGS